MKPASILANTFFRSRQPQSGSAANVVASRQRGWALRNWLPIVSALCLCVAVTAVHARTVVLICENSERGLKLTVDIEKQRVTVKHLDRPDQAAYTLRAEVTARQVIWSERMAGGGVGDDRITYVIDRHVAVLTTHFLSPTGQAVRKTVNCTKLEDTK